MKCSECRYCIPFTIQGNQNYQCQLWSKVDDKRVEIFKPHKAGCNEGKSKPSGDKEWNGYGKHIL